MSELALPEGWLKKELSVLTQVITKGTTPTTLGYTYQHSGVNFLKVENIGDNKIDLKSINQYISDEANDALKRSQLVESDILFSIAGTIGKTALVSKEHLPMNTNQAIAIIRGSDSSLVPDFLKYQLQNFIEIIKLKSRGGAMNNVSLKDLKEFEVTVPAIAEQKEVVRFLDTHLTTVSQIQARLDAIPKLIEKFRQSVLQDFLLGNNDTLYESHVLGDIVDIISGVAFKKSQYAENGSKLLQISNVGHGSIKWQSKSFISHDLASEFNGYKLSKKDIILALNRPITHNKLKVATISDKDIPSVLYQRVARLRVEGNSKVIDSEYLFILMQSDFFRNIVTNKLKGSDQPYLNFSDLKSFSLEMPKLEYQVQLVEKIKKLFLYANQIEKSVATAKARVDSLTQSILHQAFTGSLTQEWREQNPELISGDNSAEALLAKIKAEKKTAS